MFGYSFATETPDQMVALTTAPPMPGQGTRLIVTANLDHIVQLRQNPNLRKAYDIAWRRTIDGAPVFLYSRLRGIGVQSRVTGADLVPSLLERLEPGFHRPFFVVASEAIAAGLRQWAKARGFAGDAIGIEVPPFGFERDNAYGDVLAARIRDHGTTQLLFGVGCPRSETWITQRRDQLGDCYAFCVGAAMGFLVGTQRRAPPIFRRLGMEWLWRVYQEPKRLARRYFVQSWGFVGAMVDDLRGGPNRR
jgi:N-acetylglucosaminyldiphosphoundecaprenol N-acetyl-beta-D-mannosaminyltransferase